MVKIGSRITLSEALRLGYKHEISSGAKSVYFKKWIDRAKEIRFTEITTESDIVFFIETGKVIGLQKTKTLKTWS